MKVSYSSLSEQQLVTLAQQQDHQALSELIVRYMHTIRSMANRYRLPGLDSDDIVQEGLIGVMKAVRLYDPAQSSFKTFATLCIQSSMINSVRAALSQKNIPLANFAPLEELEQPANIDFCDNPEQILLAKEHFQHLMATITNVLSPKEQQTLKLYLAGHSYIEISTILSTSSKAVDNALQRVRRKLQTVI